MDSNENNQRGDHLPINQWATDDMPREKMEKNGKKSLTNSELLAILLRTGVKGHSAVDVAQQLLDQCDHRLNDLARLEINDLSKMHGLGLAKSATILAALELGSRMISEERERKDAYIRNADDLFRLLSDKMLDLPNEEFWAVYLAANNRVKSIRQIAKGGLTQTTVDLRIIFRYALESNAIALAVAHNHPSGTLTPSAADKDLTRRIAEAGKVMSIHLVDHLILGITPSGRRDYFSFSEDGLL